MTFDELLGKVAHAVAHMAHEARVSALAHYRQHFDDEGAAVTHRLHGMEVAQSTLVNHDAPVLDRLDIELETDLAPGRGDILETALSRSLWRKRVHVSLKARFRAADTPEGVHLLHERLHDAFRRQAAATQGVSSQETSDNDTENNDAQGD